MIQTPFGTRRVTYADYTASGRGLRIIERYLERLLELYGNTHTEDDATGIVTSRRLRQAEAAIKRLLHAGEKLAAFERHLMENRPVVFVGPYEHHSNEVSWRECFAEVVEVELDGEGLLDLEDLERKLSRPEYQERRRIGAFSTASNVSGLMTPVYEMARILHRHDALVFFDYAAIAPCARIDVCHGEDCFFDGIYFSPHKLLGGPGTPGIMQTLRAALALQVKERLGPERIEERERELARRAMERLRAHPAIEIIGKSDPLKRIPIFSFNVRVGDSYLHARLVTLLLNDLFGIQSRTGGSCAGPYGHRVNFHFLITDEEFDFLCAAILFVAGNGKYFLPLYEFDLATGSWRRRSFPQPEVHFDLEEALAAVPEQPARTVEAEAVSYRNYLEEARRLADELKARFSEADLATTERELIPFVYAKTSLAEMRG